MTYPALDTSVSPLRQRLIDDMNMRRFSRETQRNYLRDIGRLATFLGRSPDTATADDLRRFQIEQQDDGVPVPTMNSIVSALRFFFTHTVDRPDLARKLVRLAHPRKLPVVLSRDERSPGCSTPPRASSTRPRCRSPMAPACASPRCQC
ncbi:MAG: integrase/recombinase [Proteobacteria bacterium]|nr:integrase/recombinase [Pseudomonadota bacterium]